MPPMHRPLAAPSRYVGSFALLAALVILPAAHGTATADVLSAHTPRPLGRFEALSAYDTRRHRLVIFGGTQQGGNGETDVLLLDPAPGATPAAPTVLGDGPELSTGCAVYDSTGDRVLVFSDEGGGMWSLSCAAPMTWHAFSPPGPKPTFTHAGAIYDPKRNRVVGFGGETSDGTSTLNTTWALSLGATPTWSTLTVAGGTPPTRDRFACVYDPGNDRVLVYGGETIVGSTSTQRNDAMALTFAGGIPTWNALSITGSALPARSEPSVVFDTAGDRLIMFGGNMSGALLDEVWVLPTGVASPAWQKLSPLGTPTSRYGAVAAFEPGTNRLIVGGGSAGVYGTLVMSDAWALAVDAVPLAWAPLGVTGTAPNSPSFTGYDPAHHRFVAQAQGPDGIVAWFLSALDSTWTPAFPGGLAPRFTNNHGIVQSFYDWRSDTFYAFSVDTLYSFHPGTNPTWARAAIGGAQPDSPTIIGMWYFDDVGQRFFMIGGEELSAGFHASTEQFSMLTLGANPQWSLLAASTPLGIRQSPVVLDRRRNRMLVFGGAMYTGHTSPPSGNNDVWQIDLGTLAITALNATGTPPSPRYLFASAYDSLRDRMLVFGGGSFGAPAPGAYYLQFGPSDANGAWSRNDPVGATLPDFLNSPISAHLGDYDPALDAYVVAGTPSYWEIQPTGGLPALAVGCPPRTAWTAGTVLPLHYSIVQGVNSAHDYAWRLDGARAWPGFPLTGTQSVRAAGLVSVDIGVPVPDTAAAGLDSLRFSVHDLTDPTVRDSCGSMIGDITSPVMWALNASTAGPGSVSLVWWVADRSAAQARIERSMDGDAWAFAGNAPIGGDGSVRFTDTAVSPGERIGYRAGVPSADAGGYAWSDVAWVDVPAAGPPRLAFASAGALLVRGAADVAFTVPRAGTARLEAYDVNGRLVAARTVEAAQAGRATVRLAEAGQLRPGIYFLRLTQATARVQGRALVLPAP
jgi:hypothetical protein